MAPRRQVTQDWMCVRRGGVGRRLSAALALVAAVSVLAPVGPFAPAAVATENTVRARGIELAKVARSRAKAKSFGLAAQMFHEAYDIDRAEWRYLFSAARCEQLAGLYARAEKTYARFLKTGPTAHPLRDRAVRELTTVRIAMAETTAAAQAEAEQRRARESAAHEAAMRRAAAAKRRTETAVGATVAVTGGPATTGAATTGPATTGQAAGPLGVRGGASATSGSWQRPTGWTTLALGVVAAGVGGALYGLAMADKGDLEATVRDGRDAAGAVTALTFDDAQAKKASIDGRLQTWGAMTAAGAGVAIVGAVLLATSPRAPRPLAALAPDGSWQVGWMVRF